MAAIAPVCFDSFKSPWRCLCRSFWISRNRWRRKAKLLQEQLDQLNVPLQQSRQELLRLQRINEQLRWEIKLSAEQATATPIEDKDLPGHQFSATMICLCCQLSLIIGIRAVPKVIELFATTFNIPLKVPSRDAVRSWSCRNGVAILQEATRQDDWIWMIDHSVQLGKMFVLVVLGIRHSELPLGRALQREDMTVLSVLPTSTREKEEVSKQLHDVSESLGVPIAVLSDGAAELHHGVASLKKTGFCGVHLDDIKHKIANLLKRQLTKDPRWKAFTAQLGKTTAAIQQTELEHLLPPRKKEKARFMNLGQLIDWARMVEHELTRTESATYRRIVEKLGWIGEFRSELQQWSEYRSLMSTALVMANQEGVFAGSSDQLAERLREVEVRHAAAQEFGQQIVAFYRSNECQLGQLKQPSMRLPCSTEILESGFGGFKNRQGYHVRGTFTSLLATFASEFDTCTPDKIRRRFAQVGVKDVHAWLKKSGLIDSTQSRRTAAYARVKPSETLLTVK